MSAAGREHSIDRATAIGGCWGAWMAGVVWSVGCCKSLHERFKQLSASQSRLIGCGVSYCRLPAPVWRGKSFVASLKTLQLLASLEKVLENIFAISWRPVVAANPPRSILFVCWARLERFWRCSALFVCCYFWGKFGPAIFRATSCLAIIFGCCVLHAVGSAAKCCIRFLLIVSGV